MVVVARDPGGAEALVPVLMQLRAEAAWDLQVLARGHALDVFASAGLPTGIAEQALGTVPVGPAKVRRFLREHQVRLVLAATGFESRIEGQFIRAARQEGVPSFAFVDSWTNYRLRFLEESDGELSEAVLPDRIGVIDEFAAQEMEREGFPPERLRVVGQPALDRFAAYAVAAGHDARRCLRTKLDLPEDAQVVAFFSQPIAALYGDGGHADPRGYTEEDALAALLGAMARLDTPATLVVKLHPKEDRSRLAPLLVSGPVPYRIVRDVNGDEVVLGADVVVGMSSMALIKAAVARRPTLSVQPGLRGPDPCMLSRAGYLRTLTDPKAVRPALRAALSGARRGARRPGHLGDGRAVRRIRAILGELTGN